jgi:hypothetical protein
MPTSRSKQKLFAGIASAALVGAVPTADVAAQRSVPDFSSNDVAWIAISNDFIAAPEGPRPVGFDPAHPYVPNNRGEQPTFRISDLSNPNLKPWAKELMKKDNAEVLAGKIAFTPRSSCMPGGVPGFMMFIVEPVFIVQAPKQVVMVYSGDGQARRIHLDVPHSAKPAPSWYGESVGHYEGDTLVIDTIGFNTKTFVDNYRTPHTEKLHVTERWRLVDEGKVLEVKFTVEDPDTYVEPWSGIQRYRKVQRKMEEQVCAENNTQLFDYKIPMAGKPDF